MLSADKEKLIKDFINNLDKSVRVLVILRDELYEGSWVSMVSDLQSRLKGEPFIFKLANQIDADLQGIEALRTFENKQSINLGDFINLSSEGSTNEK